MANATGKRNAVTLAAGVELTTQSANPVALGVPGLWTKASDGSLYYTLSDGNLRDLTQSASGQTVGAQQIVLWSYTLPAASSLMHLGLEIFGHRVDGGTSEGDFVIMSGNAGYGRQGSAAPGVLIDSPDAGYFANTVAVIASGRGNHTDGASTLTTASGSYAVNGNAIELKVTGVAATTIKWHISAGSIRVFAR